MRPSAFRLFVALEISMPVRENIAAIQRELIVCRADVKWVEVENLHGTIKFLGDTDRAMVPALVTAIEQCAAGFHAPSVHVAGLGAFPSLDRPRVLWVGARDATDALTRIARSVDESLARLNVAEEKKPFHAHVTLGRVRSSRNVADLVRSLMRLGNADLGSFTATHLTLMKSELSRSGARYEALCRAPFQRATC